MIYFKSRLGVAQMVARYLGVVEAAGSNPVTQTMRRIAADKRALTFRGCALFLSCFLAKRGSADAPSLCKYYSTISAAFALYRSRTS